MEQPSPDNRPPALGASRCVIIVAGGQGLRMGAGIPKQFLPLSGRPLLMHAMTPFIRYDAAIAIVVALPAAHIDRWQQLCEACRFAVPHRTVAGGDTRTASVRNALAVADADFIAVHDGVRPLVSVDVIARSFDTAALHGSAVPVIPVTDSLRKKTGDASHSIPRENICAVQTPQVFRADWLRIAYKDTADAVFTDDASAVEAAGFALKLIDGSRDNIKITEPDDLPVAETWMALRR
ncbi:MAG: 2-C-methyl-D-erythritol 4-phosphate cytidylyltransferase [Prevotellaceae bacterium]|nr:2-C-methyl-D-erythritol 4-phosphate cytidylyltransferase [Prevotellaceae bacterium]